MAHKDTAHRTVFASLNNPRATFPAGKTPVRLTLGQNTPLSSIRAGDGAVVRILLDPIHLAVADPQHVSVTESVEVYRRPPRGERTG
jgi:hypothetical protein